jgi:hypothetical protein
MRTVKWWLGFHCCGFALYWNPNRNPIFAISKAGRIVVVSGCNSRAFAFRVA